MRRKRGRVGDQPKKQRRPVRHSRTVRLVPVKEHWYTCWCWQCEKEFKSKRVHARYCSNACKQQAYRDRIADRRAFVEMQQAAELFFSQPLYPEK